MLIQSLDYPHVHEEAHYWVHQVGTEALANTQNITIADSLRDEVINIFDVDIDEIMSSEAPTSRGGNAEVRTTMTILALCRIAVTFGVNLQPTTYLPGDLPRKTAHTSPKRSNTSVDDLPTAASEKDKRRVMPESDEEALTPASSPRDDLPTAASEKDKLMVMPKSDEEALTPASSPRDDLPTAASEKDKRRVMPESDEEALTPASTPRDDLPTAASEKDKRRVMAESDE